MQKFLHSFRQLPESNRSMVYLMWIYSAGMIITNIFVNIYVFQINNSFTDVALYNIVFFTATFIGFSWIGTYMWYIWWNIKNMYYIGYVLFMMSFGLLFLLGETLLGIYIFSTIYALWNWVFWNAVHTQELNNISDINRDFYSSSISAWANIMDVLVPLGVATVFFLSNIFSFNGYSILFAFLPFVYVFSFIFIHNIESYTPTRITYDDVRNFFNMKRYKFEHLYFFVWWFKTWFKSVILAIITITLLKNEVNVGVFQGILAFVSSFVVMYVWMKRKPDNRLLYLIIISFIIFINLSVFSWYFNMIYFVIFSFISIFLDSLYRVSEHTYDLSLMDNIRQWKSDFYPAMIMRECLLWSGRVISISLILILFLYTWLDTESLLRIGLLFIWMTFILKVMFIYLWEKYEKVQIHS